MKIHLVLLAIGVFLSLTTTVSSKRRKNKFKSGGKSSADVQKLEEKTHDLLETQADILQDLEKANDNQHKISKTLEEAEEQQHKNIKTLKSVSSLASAVESDTHSIVKGQEKILDGQKDIQKTIDEEHKKTRKALDQTEKNIENDLDKVLQRQKDILATCQKNEDVLVAGFHKLKKTEQVTQDLVDDIAKKVEENAKVYALGQANVTDELEVSETEFRKGAEALQKTRNQILNKVKNNRKSQKQKLDNILAKQSVIFNQIEDNVQKVGAEISQTLANEKQTQNIIQGTQNNIRKDLDDVKNSQSKTQHLAKKCQEAGKCDLSQVEKSLLDILKEKDGFESRVRKDLRKVRSEQSQTTKKVDSSEKAIIKAISASFDKVDKEISTLRKIIIAAKGTVNDLLKELERKIKNTRNSQTSTLKLIDKLPDITAKLIKLNDFKQSLIHH